MLDLGYRCHISRMHLDDTSQQEYLLAIFYDVYLKEKQNNE